MINHHIIIFNVEEIKFNTGDDVDLVFDEGESIDSMRQQIMGKHHIYIKDKDGYVTEITCFLSERVIREKEKNR